MHEVHIAVQQFHSRTLCLDPPPLWTPCCSHGEVQVIVFLAFLVFFCGSHCSTAILGFFSKVLVLLSDIWCNELHKWVFFSIYFCVFGVQACMDPPRPGWFGPGWWTGGGRGQFCHPDMGDDFFHGEKNPRVMYFDLKLCP